MSVLLAAQFLVGGWASGFMLGNVVLFCYRTFGDWV